MTNWPVLSLEEAGVQLIDCVHATPAAQTEGYPYVAIPQMKGGHIDFSEARRITREDFEKWTQKARPQRHDVILSRRTNPGVIAVDRTGCDFALGQNLVLLRANGSRVLPEFLRWLASGPIWWEQIEKFKNVGAVFDSLRCADVPKFELPIPPKEDQHHIARLLGALDDKIELNRRMNETLERMAQAIFRDWFVDFGPVRRKLEGATDPVKIMGGVVQETDEAARLAALFPAAFADNGLPEGWEEKGLDEIADFLNGLALQKYPADIESDSLPVIKIAELRSGISPKSNRASRTIPEKYIIQDGDFLFSWSGSLMAKFWTEDEGALNQHLFKVSSQRYPRWFYSQWVFYHLPSFQITAASKATTMGHIQRHHLSAAKVVCPPTATLNGMSEVIGPLVDRTIHNDLENQTLAAMRDLLLPKLMSGEIRLKDAEKIAEAAE